MYQPGLKRDSCMCNTRYNHGLLPLYLISNFKFQIYRGFMIIKWNMWRDFCVERDFIWPHMICLVRCQWDDWTNFKLRVTSPYHKFYFHPYIWFNHANPSALNSCKSFCAFNMKWYVLCLPSSFLDIVLLDCSMWVICLSFLPLYLIHI